MFKIRYKIFDDLEDELEGNEFYGENGYFQLIVGQYEYGVYLDKELDSLSVSIYWWMRYLIEATLKLKEKNIIYVSDIETPKIWIELKKKNNANMTISKIESPKLDGFSVIESESRIESKKVDWGEEIDLEKYKRELIRISEKYLNNLYSLNSKKNIYIEELEKLLKQLKNQEKI